MGPRIYQGFHLAERTLDALHNVPLILPAPTEEGCWTNRSTSTLEAKKWFLSVLSRSLDRGPEMNAIHCLKRQLSAGLENLD